MAEDAVVKAISTIMEALTPLDADAREHVLEFVLKRLGIKPNGWSEKSAASGLPSAAPAILPTPSGGYTDIRSFAAEKQPQTLNEKVAVVAYFLAHLAPAEERRDSVATDDIRPYFIQANFELPTGPINMALTNAKNAGYLNALSERGQYRLNSVGHNLVAHKLPSQGSSRRKPAKRTKK
jgi:hypothetical protein